jgi:hypothetical protein
VQPQSTTDYLYAYLDCDMFALYDSALRAMAGNAAPNTVMSAIRSVGPAFVTAATVRGRVDVGSTGRPTPGLGRLFGYVGGRFVYTSATFSL